MDALDRRLGDPVYRGGLRQAGGLQDGRRDVDHMGELLPELAAAVIRAGQCTMVPLRVPPQCEATCLVHWYGVHRAWAQPTA